MTYEEFIQSKRSGGVLLAIQMHKHAVLRKAGADVQTVEWVQQLRGVL